MLCFSLVFIGTFEILNYCVGRLVISRYLGCRLTRDEGTEGTRSHRHLRRLHKLWRSRHETGWPLIGLSVVGLNGVMLVMGRVAGR
jgi:hypothetical protein